MEFTEANGHGSRLEIKSQRNLSIGTDRRRFGGDVAGFWGFRISFAADDARLDAALNRIAKALAT